MEIIVDKNLLLQKFFIPLNRFTDQIIVDLHPDSMECISYNTTDKQSIILYAKLYIKTSIPTNETTKLNIGSLKKFIQALNCLQDLSIIKLDIEKNHIAYKSSDTNFKFHLKEDGIINVPPINLDKILAITTPTSFDLTSEKVDEIIRAGSFSNESNKVYISNENGILQAELTDKTIPNLDSMRLTLTNEITGTPLTTPIILKLDIFKTLSTIKFDKVNIKISDKGAVIFELVDKDYNIKYITSCLVK